MEKILYCEDNLLMRKVTCRLLCSRLPQNKYEILEASSVGEGLSKLTGISLDGLNRITKDTVLDAIRQGEPDYSKLKLVLTDGKLDDSLMHRKPNEGLFGWDLAYILRNTGYSDMLMYFGASEVPSEYRSLFTKIFMKPEFDSDQILSGLYR